MSQKAIIQYINLLCSSNISSLQHLSSGQIFCQLISLIEPSKIDKSKIQQIDTWMQKLMNLKLAVKYLLIEYQQQFTNKPQLDFDLLKIAKYYDHKQIIKLFEAMLFIFLNCQNKEEFIKKIMEMREESQHYMMDTVRKLIDTNIQEQNQIQDKQINEKTKLLEKMDELQHQLQIIRNQNSALQEQATSQHNQNIRLNLQLSKLSQNVMNLNMELSTKQSKPSKSNIFDNSSLIESLKEKLITESVQHEREKMKFNEEIELMRVKLEKIDQMETRVENYQQRNNQLNQRVQELQDDLFHDKQDLKRKTMLVEKLQEKCRLFEEKLNKEELEKISLQVNVQKLNVRNSRNDESKRVSTIESNRSDPYLEYESKRQSEQQLSIANRRIKTLEKELAKTSLKAEKASKLEVDKKELEETFVIEINNKKQEIDLLSSALVELRRMFSDFISDKTQ